MSRLHLSSNFSLPREALLHVWSLLGVRGAGKTYNASVIVEEILERKMMPVVVVDPMDVWWGLKSSADGKSAGYPVIVMGGTHADVPLEPTAGALVADFFIEHRQSSILVFADLDKGWPKAQQVRFVADFGARLFERNAGHLMFLVVDEADLFANQRPGKDELRCLGVMESIVKRGRTPGIMPLLITQRSSNLNKNVLDETEMLVALRTSSPRDQDALDSWFRHLPKTQKERREILLETWAKLPNGTAWFWCPSMNLFQQVQVRERRTFNSSATPEFGEKPKEPKVLAPVDLEALKHRMAATIERAKATDPKELQREVARLKVELAKKPASAPVAPTVKEVRVEVPMLKDTQITRLESLVDRWLKGSESVTVAARDLLAGLTKVKGNGAGPGAAAVRMPAVAVPVSRPVIVPRRPVQVRESEGDVDLRAGARRILQVMAERHPMTLTTAQVRTLAGLRKSGTSDSYLSILRREGLIEDQNGVLTLTDRGLETAPPFAHPSDPVEAWRSKLRAGARKMLDVVLAHPRGLTKEDLLEQTGLMKSGTSDSYFSTLRRNGLITYDGHLVRVGEILLVPA